MMRIRELEHRFVRSIPRELEPGVLYVSMDYGTAVHSCCCGCGEQVVTPFSPTDWKMIYDGESVSLTPSIGNWHLACRSHYVIRQGRVVEAESWGQEQVDAEHRRDRVAKARFYSDQAASSKGAHDARPRDPAPVATEPTRLTHRTGGFWSSVTTWLFGSSSEK